MFGLLFLLVVAQQVGSGFFATELARHPDEPAHFVTGVLVYDYLRSGFDQTPMSFAEQFQAQYRKSLSVTGRRCSMPSRASGTWSLVSIRAA